MYVLRLWNNDETTLAAADLTKIFFLQQKANATYYEAYTKLGEFISRCYFIMQPCAGDEFVIRRFSVEYL
jgi:hypothetical protein